MRETHDVTLADLKDLGKTFAKECPLTWQMISRKRYLLPTYRQDHYFSQELLDTIMACFLANYSAGRFGSKPDPVIRHMYRTNVLALLEQRPMWFLERELGEKLLVTHFPGDLGTDEIHWRRKIMRIMLPRNLVTINRPEWPAPRSLMYVDIGRADANAWIKMDLGNEKELRTYMGRRGMIVSELVSIPLYQKGGIIITGQLEARDDGVLGENYAVMRRLEGGMKLKDIQQGGVRFETSAMCDDTDDTFLVRMENIAINVLLFMGSVPLEYEAEQTPTIRKLEVLKDRIIPELLHAKFVGRSQYRPSQKPHYHIANFTGKHLPLHWKAGHWKRQVFGVGRQERKLIWIEPYQAGLEDDSESGDKHDGIDSPRVGVDH